MSSHDRRIYKAIDQGCSYQEYVPASVRYERQTADALAAFFFFGMICTMLLWELCV